VLWRTRFAASTQPILLRKGPNSKVFSRHCLSYNVTVCALLSFTGSWVRSLRCFHYSAATVDRTTQRREALLSHARTHTYTHFNPHPREQRLLCKICTVRTNESLRPEQWFKIRGITGRYDCTNGRTLVCYSYRENVANTKMANRTLRTGLSPQFCNYYRT
jgi:hypothetical protein